MNKYKTKGWVAASAALAFGYPQFSSAQMITNAEFLERSENYKSLFISSGVLMAGQLVFAIDEERANCVWRWYFDHQDERLPMILGTMESYPDYTPSGTMIALLQKECGSLLPDGESYGGAQTDQ